MEEKNTAVCPKCGQTYTERPAISRVTGDPICPDCGTREAMEAMGVPPEEQEKVVEVIHKYTKN